MPFAKLPMPARRFLLLLLPCAALSACSTPIALTQAALPCPELVRASGLLTRTPGAPLPADDNAGTLAMFGIQQTGQLERANADKSSAAAILDTCEAWQAKAAAAAKPRRWWQGAGR
jgi:hypothetical protein